MSDTPQVFVDEAPSDEQVKAIQGAFIDLAGKQVEVMVAADEGPKAQTAPVQDTPSAPSAENPSTSAPPAAASVSLTGATPSAPVEGALNASNALAGTSGVPAGQLNTGMAAGEPTVKLSSTVPPSAEQPQLDLGDTPTNVNVSAIGAPHPVVAKVNGLVAELRLIISNIEKSPAVMRAEKDLQTCEEWVVQHFEDLKRKL